MVAFYKHDIPAWMDGTEALSDGAYRAYHVIVQLIYLNEGPITLNERGIAGRCGQSTRAFRRNLDELISCGKIRLENGRLVNIRAEKELEKIGNNRENARVGGENSGKSRRASPKPLKSQQTEQAPLQDDRSLKDKTRLDESKPRAREAEVDLRSQIAKAFERVGRLPPDTNRCAVWLSQGFDPEICVAVVTDKLSRGAKVTNLAYFDAAIKEAHEQRPNGAHQPKPAATPDDRARQQRACAKAWKNGGSWCSPWDEVCGGPPDSARCTIPQAILDELGIPPPPRKPAAA